MAIQPLRIGLLAGLAGLGLGLASSATATALWTVSKGQPLQLPLLDPDGRLGSAAERTTLEARITTHRDAAQQDWLWGAFDESNRSLWIREADRGVGADRSHWIGLETTPPSAPPQRLARPERFDETGFDAVDGVGGPGRDAWSRLEGDGAGSSRLGASQLGASLRRVRP